MARTSDTGPGTGVAILVGVDNPVPPRKVQNSTQDAVNEEIEEVFDFGKDERRVSLTVIHNVGSTAKEKFGEDVRYVQQYDILTSWDEVSDDELESVESVVANKVEELNFDIVGTESNVV